VTHRRVTDIEPYEVRCELSASRDALERELGVRPTAFSYPFGAINDVAVAAAKESGYVFTRSLELDVQNRETTHTCCHANRFSVTSTWVNSSDCLVFRGKHRCLSA